jgi:putative phosphoribosyl transferase
MSGIELLEELRNREQVFRDRDHAGQILAGLMRELSGSEAWVLGIPGGGLPVAASLCRSLALRFDVAVVSKITLPWNGEAGYGAVAFDGSVRLNEPLIHDLLLDDLEVRYGIEKTKAKVERRLLELHGDGGFEHLRDATVVLVDDGMASGFTMLAAIDAVRHLKARSVLVAVPTASRDAAVKIADAADHLYCANIRGRFPFAVADAYQHWHDLDEEELKRLVAVLKTEGRMSA